MKHDDSFIRLIEDTLAFEYQSGGVTTIQLPHSTAWRELPCLLTAQLVSGRSLLEIAGRRPLEIADGALICLAPGVRHCVSLQTAVGVSRWSHVNFTILGGLDVVSLLQLPPRVTGAAAEQLGNLNAELAALNARSAGALTQAVRRKSLGLRLLLGLIETAGLREMPLLRQHQRLAGIFGHIAGNLQRRITCEELARQVHLSPSRFHAVFRSATGQGPRDYVLRLRLRRAQELLIASDLAVKEIAARVGIADPFFFSRIFSQKCGMSPSQYRQAARLAAL